MWKKKWISAGTVSGKGEDKGGNNYRKTLEKVGINLIQNKLVFSLPPPFSLLKSGCWGVVSASFFHLRAYILLYMRFSTYPQS